VGICVVVRRPDLTAYDLKQMKYAAVFGAYTMADELGRERPKNTTVTKPGGTVPKIMDTTEGIKRPDGRFLLNRVNFRRDDPVLRRLFEAGYRVEDHPSMADSCLAVLPYEYADVAFGRHADGTPINTESAVAQLERYRFIMDHYCEQNASTTIMWSPGEIPDLVRWFDRHWDSVVGVSFCLRNDHTVTADMLGYAYLPQSIVDEPTFRAYAAGIGPVDLDDLGDLDSFDAADVGGCEGGACPIR
jgi:ribonucleoside-triphosphate reductase (formate)